MEIESVGRHEGGGEWTVRRFSTGLRQDEADRFNDMALAIEARERAAREAEKLNGDVVLRLTEAEAQDLTYCLFLVNRDRVDTPGISKSDAVDLWTKAQAQVFPQIEAMREGRRDY
jgi:hypothetical protein